MKHEDIETILADTQAPMVANGSHRARLKRDLLGSLQEQETAVWTCKRKVAWACCIALVVLAATAAAAHKVLKSFEFFEEGPTEDVVTTSPDGTKSHWQVSTSRSTNISSDDPDFTEEDARRQYEECKRAIAEGTAKLVEVKEREDGLKIYIYKITCSNGKVVTWATNTPSPHRPREKNVDYEEIERSIAEGKAEFIKMTEADSGLRVYIYKIPLPDGEYFRFGGNVPPEYMTRKREYNAQVEELVAERKGELIGTAESESGETSYVYKATLPDGVVVTFFGPSPSAEE